MKEVIHKKTEKKNYTRIIFAGRGEWGTAQATETADLADRSYHGYFVYDMFMVP